jgi:hypothetical protein
VNTDDHPADDYLQGADLWHHMVWEPAVARPVSRYRRLPAHTRI